MKSYTFGKNYFYESSYLSSKKDFSEDLEEHVNSIIRSFTKRRLFRILLKLYGTKYDLEGYILLQAHGIKGKRWKFWDGKRKYIVQDWIDRMDGKALAILLRCCNPKNYDIHSERSVVIHPKDSVNLMDLIRGGHLRVYVPGEGYLEDNYYRLRRVIDKLSVAAEPD